MFFSLGGVNEAIMEAGHPVMNDFFKTCKDIVVSASGHIPNSVPAFMNQQEFGLILPAVEQGGICQSGDRDNQTD